MANADSDFKVDAYLILYSCQYFCARDIKPAKPQKPFIAIWAASILGRWQHQAKSRT
jgi:hypothetical protein